MNYNNIGTGSESSQIYYVLEFQNAQDNNMVSNFSNFINTRTITNLPNQRFFVFSSQAKIPNKFEDFLTFLNKNNNQNFENSVNFDIPNNNINYNNKYAKLNYSYLKKVWSVAKHLTSQEDSGYEELSKTQDYSPYEHDTPFFNLINSEESYNQKIYPFVKSSDEVQLPLLNLRSRFRSKTDKNIFLNDKKIGNFDYNSSSQFYDNTDNLNLFPEYFSIKDNDSYIINTTSPNIDIPVIFQRNALWTSQIHFYFFYFIFFIFCSFFFMFFFMFFYFIFQYIFFFKFKLL